MQENVKKGCLFDIIASNWDRTIGFVKPKKIEGYQKAKFSVSRLRHVIKILDALEIDKVEVYLKDDYPMMFRVDKHYEVVWDDYVYLVVCPIVEVEEDE